MPEDKQIEDLKSQFRRTTESELQKRIVNTISAYQNNGIDTINELISSTIDDEVKSHGLNLIKKIKQNSYLIFSQTTISDETT
jgi:hypothetical protein